MAFYTILPGTHNFILNKVERMMRLGETIPNPLHDSALIHRGVSLGTEALGSLFVGAGGESVVHPRRRNSKSTSASNTTSCFSPATASAVTASNNKDKPQPQELTNGAKELSSNSVATSTTEGILATTTAAASTANEDDMNNNHNDKTSGSGSSNHSSSCLSSLLTSTGTGSTTSPTKNKNNYDNVMMGHHHSNTNGAVSTTSSSSTNSSSAGMTSHSTSNHHTNVTNSATATSNSSSIFVGGVRRPSKNYGTSATAGVASTSHAAGGAGGTLANLCGVAPPLPTPPVNNPISGSHHSHSSAAPTHNQHQHNVLQALLWGDHGTAGTGAATGTASSAGGAVHDNNAGGNSNAGVSDTFGSGGLVPSSSSSQHQVALAHHQQHQQDQQRRRSSSSLQLLQHANDLLFHSNFNIFQMPVEDFSTLDLLFGDSSHSGHQLSSLAQQNHHQQHQQSNHHASSSMHNLFNSTVASSSGHASSHSTTNQSFHQNHHPHNHYYASSVQQQQQQHNAMTLGSKNSNFIGSTADSSNVTPEVPSTNALSSFSHLFSSSSAAASGTDYIQNQHGGSASRYVSSCSFSSSSPPSITSTIDSADHTDKNSNQNFSTTAAATHHGGFTCGDFISSLGINTGSGHPYHEYQKPGSFSDCTTSSIRSRTGGEEKNTSSNSTNGQQQIKKKRKKRPRGHPSRPLSAYNLFFKDERQRILDSLPSNRASSDKESHGGAKDPRDEITWPGKRRRPHGKIGFENLAKEIGARWKNIDEETKEHYKKLALEDLQRYSREMQEYEGRLASIGGLKLHKTSISSSDDDNE